jgi:outer membrane protein TolC
MRLRLARGLRVTKPIALAMTILLVTMPVQAEPLSLEHAIRLALKHSTSSLIASAEVQRTFASYRELRNNYIPQLNVGSGLGYSYGNPVAVGGAAPSLANVSAQSTVFNPAQHHFLDAAKIDWHASESQDKEQRGLIIQEVALTYAELLKWEARLGRLRQDEADAQKTQEAVSQRVQEGVDSAVEINKAKLVVARVRFHRAEARGNSDVLRRHLSNLTGLSPTAIELAPETVPALPPVNGDEDLPQRAIALSPAVKVAEQHSLAETMRAKGEHSALYPSIDFSAQYVRLSTFNNYTDYFPNHFQPDNATIGFALRIPLFNASQHARAEAAEAESRKATQQAQAARNQVAEETLKLQRAAEQLEAAREVAQLEYQLAVSGVEAAQTKIDAQTGTLRELADARVQAAERYLMFQDADFEYQRVRINLLRATGELESWALPATPTNIDSK